MTAPRNTRYRVFILALAAMLLALAPPVQAANPPAVSDRFMVSTANPLATMAARDIILKGGSAVDAAIAAQLVLTLTEPQSSGLGGGAFLLTYNAADGTVASYDGRETAPASATPDLFVRPDGTVMDWTEAAEGGIPVGVPGVIAMLEMAHADQGRLPWADLFGPAVALAEKGFLLSPRLYEVLDWVEGPERFPAFYAQFYTLSGERKAVGTRLTNPALAASLRAIAEGGTQAFYQGAIAEEIVAAVNDAEVNPGVMTLEDLAGYQAVRRDPICTTYRTWAVCGMGPPSSGGIAVAQILGLLERFDMAGIAPGSVEAVHLVAEAERLAYADRDLLVADSDFVAVPIEALLDPAYLGDRSMLIDPSVSMGIAQPGLTADDRAAFDDDSNLGFSTSHISIVDMEGNAVSMTTSIERGFGSRRWPAVSCSTTNSPIFPLRRRPMAFRSPTGWRRASGRARPWRQRWCSTRTAIWSWRSARSGARASSVTSPRP